MPKEGLSAAGAGSQQEEYEKMHGTIEQAEKDLQEAKSLTEAAIKNPEGPEKKRMDEIFDSLPTLMVSSVCPEYEIPTGGMNALVFWKLNDSYYYSAFDGHSAGLSEGKIITKEEFEKAVARQNEEEEDFEKKK